jgi:type IV pilus assembly protein PilB
LEQTDYIALSTELLQVITTDQAWYYHIVPKTMNQSKLEFFIDEKNYHEGLPNELEILLGKSIAFEKVDSDIISKTLGKYYRKGNSSLSKRQNKFLSSVASEDFLPRLIAEAKELGSSDIHIESYEDKCRIRIRIDGQLVERYIINKADYPAMVNKVKIRANLDISEKRLPQDGRIYFNSDGHKFDIRVSVLPTLHGEKIVLRILNNDATNIHIEGLGFRKEELENFMEGVKKPHGIVLISGPTGSGKTTTLYATLKILNKEKTNILTVEDPIEYTLEGINQVQLKESIGLTFAKALRTFLRQDPDVIMLGEIRDAETAQMAIRAALTGHLVLSTIHTNSAWGTVSRLVDMGVQPFLIASTLNTTAAQRLIRLLCKDCKEHVNFEKDVLPRNFKLPSFVTKHYIAKGCEHCYFTGYRGRKAVYEIIPLDYELSEKIKSNDLKIDEQLKERNIRTLAENAFEVFALGETSAEEIYPILINTI